MVTKQAISLYRRELAQGYSEKWVGVNLPRRQIPLTEKQVAHRHQTIFVYEHRHPGSRTWSRSFPPGEPHACSSRILGQPRTMQKKRQRKQCKMLHVKTAPLQVFIPDPSHLQVAAAAALCLPSSYYSLAQTEERPIQIP